MIQTLMRHGFLCELGVGLVGVGDEGDAARGEDADPVDLAPLGEVARDDFFDVVGDVDAADVEGAVLPHEAADAAHVVAVIGVFIAAEAVDVGVEGVEEAGQAVEVLALVAARTEAFGEE